MSKSNFERMIELAEAVFDARHDPEQLDVDESVIAQLLQLHPSTVSEHNDGNGPVAWVLLIPTTTALMHRFLKKEINEKELLSFTHPNETYDALYLCSALVLDEYRRKGIVNGLCVQAIENIKKDHPLKSLFVWAFSPEGDAAAETIAKITSLPLSKRE